jgi:type II secretory pathway predicted ATPase ExeA
MMRRGDLVERIQRQTEDALGAWGLSHNPFMKTPPPDHIRREVFTDREQEMERLIRAVFANPINILVFGTYGIGKTVFLLESLCELSTSKRVLPIYTTLEGETAADFDATVLFALANATSSWNRKSKEIYDILTGKATAEAMEREFGAEVGAGELMPVSLTIGGRGKESETIQKDAIMHPRHEFTQLLKDCQRRYSRIIMAVDEVDKHEPQPFQSLVSGSRATLDAGCSFILTGSLWAALLTQNPNRSIYGAFGEEIELEPFDLDTTRDVIVAYLNSARNKKSESIQPFTDDAVEYVFDCSGGVPRRFNQMCYEAINGAIKLEVKEIDADVVRQCQRDSGHRKYKSLQGDEQFIVDTMKQHGGMLSDDTPDVLAKLGALTIFEIYSVLEKLVQQDVLVKREGTRSVYYEVEPSLREVDDDDADGQED